MGSVLPNDGSGQGDIEQATRLILIRHGETDWNAATRIQGHTDEPLNARGRWQGAQLAAALHDEDLAAVYSSDLQRAADTARALALPHGLAVQFDTRLRERGFGAFEGLTFHEIETRLPDAAQRWRQRDVDFAPGESGETLTTLWARCMAAAQELAARHAGQCIALVAHGGVLDCWYRAATCLSLTAPRSWQLGNASINRVLYSPQGFVLVGWGDSAHLERGAATALK